MTEHIDVTGLWQRRVSTRVVADRARGGHARSIYIHVPFCFHKCHYCDFYSIVDSRDRQGVFVDRLIQEFDAWIAPARPGSIDTVFVGGGTPTLLRVELWERLLEAMGERFDLGGDPEFTVECNPETASSELFDVLRTGGVNRLSFGAQSFNPTHLKTLERWHDPASVPRAIELAGSAGIDRLSLDLIFAIPGQTLDEWHDDLTRALSMGVDHLSAYNLTYEPNTAMTKRLQRGEFEPTGDDLEADMYERTLETLHEHGLERYEVSNYARPGLECAHNLAYWRQRDWLAFGPSASGHLGGWRWKNSPRLDEYLNSDGFSPAIDVEEPDAKRNLAEWIMTGMRIAEGLDAEELLARAESLGTDAPGRLNDAARVHEQLGRITIGDRWRLTESGFLFADGIAGDLMAALDR